MEEKEAEATSSALWFLRSKQSLKRQHLRPLLRTMTLFAQSAPILSFFECQCPGCLLLNNTFECNLKQPLVLCVISPLDAAQQTACLPDR